MLKNIEEILKLSKSRIKDLENDNENWYEGYKTYIDGIKDELSEVEDEIKKHNSVYLEDELGDVFWDYLCLIHSLEENGYVDSKNVFNRCNKKFQERITGVREFKKERSGIWGEIKSKQKEELRIEHEEKHGKTSPNLSGRRGI